MDLPTISKNWCFTANGASSLNQIITANQGYESYLARRAALYYLKRTLCGFAQGPWTVVQSCDGLSSGGNYGYADYWTSPAALGTYGAGRAPWIVLQNTFAGRMAQILIAAYVDGTTTGKAYLTFAPDLFGAGTTSPPAIPAKAMKWCGDYVTNNMDFFTNVRGISRLHVMQTWDNTEGVESLRFALYQGGSCYGWAFLDRLYNIPSGGSVVWDFPVVGTWFGRTANYYPNFACISNTANSTTAHAVNGTTKMQVFGTADIVTYNNVVPNWNTGTKNSLEGKYQIVKLNGFVSNTETGIGWLGNVEDFWIGSSYIASGSYYPISTPATPQFVQIGQFVWPWDSAVGIPQTF